MSAPTVVVWFSCGAASAAAAKLTIDLFGKENVRVVNNPVAEEGDDNPRFLRDVEKWLGVEIENRPNPKFPSNSAYDVWEKEKAMAFPTGAPCTRHLKKAARQLWESENRFDYLVMGFTVEEQDRFDNFKLGERDNILPVLIDAGMTKDDCARMVVAAGIRLPVSYELGYPNANCFGYVKATSPTYWNHVRKVHPDVFASRAEQSRRLGARLVRVKGVRIFLDELSPDAKGRPMKTLQMPDCGIFCEEQPTSAEAGEN